MKRLFIFLIMVTGLCGCHGSDNTPDVSDIKVTFKVERFDHDLFALDSTRLPEEWPGIIEKYPSFAHLFLQDVLGLERAADSPSIAFGELRHFLTQNKVLRDSVFAAYPNTDKITRPLEKYFPYVKHYYPDYQVPTLITFIGNFGGRELYTPDGLAIGLDFYMGSNFSYYQIPEVQEVYPDYVSRKFAPEYLPVNIMAAVVDDLYPEPADTVTQSLIEQIIDRGRRMYLQDKFLPGVEDTLKLGYTGKQYTWCKANEGLIWNFLAEQNVLYSADPDVIKNYMGDAPSTQTMPNQSPGNIGSFVGWQIVRSYVARRGDPGPKKLMEIPWEDLLSKSQYNPK